MCPIQPLAGVSEALSFPLRNVAQRRKHGESLSASLLLCCPFEPIVVKLAVHKNLFTRSPLPAICSNATESPLRSFAPPGAITYRCKEADILTDQSDPKEVDHVLVSERSTCAHELNATRRADLYIEGQPSLDTRD
jgi:hypothetical protein